MDLNLLVLLIILSAAWVAGALASRLGFSSAVGALVAGIVLGPPILGFLNGSPALGVLAEVGALMMMLYVGTEIDPRKLGSASWSGLLTAYHSTQKERRHLAASKRNEHCGRADLAWQSAGLPRAVCRRQVQRPVVGGHNACRFRLR